MLESEFIKKKSQFQDVI